MKQKIHPFLMFSGTAEEAMNYYVSVFNDSEVLDLIRYGSEEPGEEGTVRQAVFSIKGEEIICIDSSVEHDFSFTPAISLFVTCDTEEEIEDIYQVLTQDGEVFMPLAEYPHSEKYAWVADKYGVTWQLNLAVKQ